MLLIVSIAGAAALAVAAYTRLRAQSPETAAAAARAVRQLAAVVIVCARAVEGVIDALHATTTPRPLYATASRWDDEDDPYDPEDDE